jgi:meso-butanediol dehydrogenase / (S,S)-butanediol dehydrogenase / diacetyl reductase
MTMQLGGKVAIVTGSGSGIGRASAQLFAEEGASVVVVDCNKSAAEETVESIRKKGLKATLCHADVSKAQDAERMVETAVKEHGKLDILFNNAAVQFMAKLVDTTEEVWDKVQSVNLKGFFLGCKYAIPAMIRAGGGSIVNMSSALGFVGDPDLVAYGAAKGGIIAFTKAAAMGYGPYKIRVNCICPGDVDTPLLQDYFNSLPDPAGFRQEVYSKYALRRIAEPRDIAQLALFLASDASSFMTASVVVIDGGLTSKCY